MARTFKKKIFLKKINVRKSVGSYEKLRKILKERGLLEDVVSTTSKGGGGTIWIVEMDGGEYIAISTYSHQVIPRHFDYPFYFYKYFLVKPDKLDEVLQILQ
jgi:hypothetical protein